MKAPLKLIDVNFPIDSRCDEITFYPWPDISIICIKSILYGICTSYTLNIEITMPSDATELFVFNPMENDTEWRTFKGFGHYIGNVVTGMGLFTFYTSYGSIDYTSINKLPPKITVTCVVLFIPGDGNHMDLCKSIHSFTVKCIQWHTCLCDSVRDFSNCNWSLVILCAATTADHRGRQSNVIIFV